MNMEDFRGLSKILWFFPLYQNDMYSQARFRDYKGKRVESVARVRELNESEEVSHSKSAVIHTVSFCAYLDRPF